MHNRSVLLAAVAVSLVATPFVVAAAGGPTPVLPATATARAEAPVLRTQPVAGPAAVEASRALPCARKVRVVYAGYAPSSEGACAN